MIGRPSFEVVPSLYYLAIGEVLLYAILLWMVLAFRIRKQSWRLLRRYSLLIPAFVAYLYFVFRPIGFSFAAVDRAYLCFMISVGHCGVGFLLIDLSILKWSLRRGIGGQQIPKDLTKVDVAVLLIPTLVIFLLMWLVFAYVTGEL
ncbi:MAG: hypothetical protein SVT52_09420 [Planctomycetota bacterium]|nr:hypothetical protein [Planctomycetota bacterium]